MAAHRRFRAIAMAIATVVAASGLVYSVSAAPAPAAVAAPVGLFDASNIISDSQFFDGNAMSVDSIQNFIQSQNCTPRDGVPCLRDYRESTPTKANQGSGHCTQYTGAASETAATIIAKVAQACRISPKVLLVLMQKEQSLLTNPSSYGYERTMGWGCPDTAACNSLYFGFFNQVYRSAWQFREYTLNPGEWRYRVGATYVQYHPNADCGGTTLNIQNQATANLYNYTPYQPNQAALNNLYGTGDACSAYGNRNFWRMYYDWFGSPNDQSPLGSVDNIQQVPGGVGIWGWTLDPETTNSLDVHVYANGRMVGGGTANVSRPDVGAAYSLGNNHGFALTIPLSGLNNICVYAINQGSGQNTTLRCVTVNIANNPVGSVDLVQPQPGGLGIWGWAIDPDTVDPISVHIYMDGRMVAGGTANGVRGDVAAARPQYGAKHGYNFTFPASPGSHRVCAFGINVGSGSTNTELGCRQVEAGGNPVGSLDSVSSGLGSYTASGWAIDPDTKDPIDVHFYVDGKFSGATTANTARPDLGYWTAFGTNHGYSVKIAGTNGAHRVCAFGINKSAGTVNTQLGCTNFEIGGSPVGAMENGQPGFASISAYGWVYDKDTAAPAGVHVYVDGAFAGSTTADVARPDVRAIPDEYGDNHGYGVTVPATPGNHQVCVFGLNIGYGGNSQLGCFTTTVSGNPIGFVENIQTVGQKLGVWGWAIDPDTTGPVGIHVYVDGAFAGGTTAATPRADLGAAYPRFGNAHAFGVEVPASPGAHTVCVYALNTGVGQNTTLGCIAVVRS